MSVTLTGGPFTNAEGTAIANGFLKLKLSKDARRTGGQVAGIYDITIPLDSSGNIATNKVVYGNDELTPSDSYYNVTVQDSNRAQVYGPVMWVLSGGGTINVNTIDPVTGVAGAGVSVDSSFDTVKFDRANLDVLLSRASANVLQLGTGDSFIPQTDGGVFGSTLKRWVSHLLNAVFYGATSGSTTLQSAATASGTLTLPAATDTLVGLATADTLTNKTLTAPVIATISNAGTVTLPTGARTLVARDTTDTLSNKTLTDVGSGNSVTMLNRQGALAAVVGTGADANLFTYSLPANTMQAGKGVRIRAVFKHTTGTASVTYKVKLGSTTLFAPATTDSTNDLAIEQLIFNNSGVQNAQTTHTVGLTGGTAFLVAGGIGGASENTANALTIAITFNVAASDQVTPKFFLVEIVQ